MSADSRALIALLHPLRGYLDRITKRADNDARAAGLAVEVGPGWIRCYRDPRFDQPDQLTAQYASERRRYADVRAAMAADATTVWSTPTLTVSASVAGAGWSQ